MALTLTEDQRMLRDAAQDFFTDAAPVDEFRGLRDAGEVYSPELWRQMVELGWTAISVPEDYDGLDFGITGLGLIAIEVGRHLVASPLVTTAALGTTALVAGDNDPARQKLLPAIASGEVLVAVAFDEGNHHDPASIRMAAKRTDDGFVLEGSKQFVAEGNYADHLIVVAREGDSPNAPHVLLVVDAGAEGVARTPVRLMDSRDYANIEFSGVAVPRTSVLASGGDAAAAVQRLADVAAVITACELYGCAQSTFDQTLQYLTEREQFGQVIGTFQALQHRAAHAFTELELLKSVVFDALDAAERNRPDLAIAASHAKALANDTAQLVTNEGIQMHGGIGVTDELDIGLFFKRVRVLRNVFGNSRYHRRRFATLNGY